MFLYNLVLLVIFSTNALCSRGSDEKKFREIAGPIGFWDSESSGSSTEAHPSPTMNEEDDQLKRETSQSRKSDELAADSMKTLDLNRSFEGVLSKETINPSAKPKLTRNESFISKIFTSSESKNPSKTENIIEEQSNPSTSPPNKPVITRNQSFISKMFKSTSPTESKNPSKTENINEEQSKPSTSPPNKPVITRNQSFLSKMFTSTSPTESQNPSKAENVIEEQSNPLTGLPKKPVITRNQSFISKMFTSTASSESKNNLSKAVNVIEEQQKPLKRPNLHNLNSAFKKDSSKENVKAQNESRVKRRTPFITNIYTTPIATPLGSPALTESFPRTPKNVEIVIDVELKPATKNFQAANQSTIEREEASSSKPDVPAASVTTKSRSSSESEIEMQLKSKTKTVASKDPPSPTIDKKPRQSTDSSKSS